MYVILVAIDLSLAFMKTAFLHYSGRVGPGEAAVEAVVGTRHWCIFLASATLHFAGDVTLGFTTAALH